MYEAGVRFNKDLHIAISFDETTGDCAVVAQITTEGETHELTGVVTWDD